MYATSDLVAQIVIYTRLILYLFNYYYYYYLNFIFINFYGLHCATMRVYMCMILGTYQFLV